MHYTLIFLYTRIFLPSQTYLNYEFEALEANFESFCIVRCKRGF